MPPPVPKAEAYISSDFGQSASGFATEAYSSVEILAGILNGEPVSAAPVEYAFTILDGHLYDTLGLSVSAKNDAIVDAHPLTVQEMGRQIRAMDRLATAGWRDFDWVQWRQEVAKQGLLF